MYPEQPKPALVGPACKPYFKPALFQPSTDLLSALGWEAKERHSHSAPQCLCWAKSMTMPQGTPSITVSTQAIDRALHISLDPKVPGLCSRALARDWLAYGSCAQKRNRAHPSDPFHFLLRILHIVVCIHPGCDDLCTIFQSREQVPILVLVRRGEPIVCDWLLFLATRIHCPFTMDKSAQYGTPFRAPYPKVAFFPRQSPIDAACSACSTSEPGHSRKSVLQGRQPRSQRGRKLEACDFSLLKAADQSRATWEGRERRFGGRRPPASSLEERCNEEAAGQSQKKI